MSTLTASLLILTGCIDSVETAHSSKGPREFALEQIVRIGAFSEGPSEYLFSLITGVEVDTAAGEVYVSDRDAREIRVFSRDGRFVRRIGGPGEGPAEFDRAPEFGVANDTVVAMDQTGIHVFRADGTHVRTGRLATESPSPLVGGVEPGPEGWRMTTLEVGQTPTAPWHARLYELQLGTMEVSGPVLEIEQPTEQGIYRESRGVTLSGDGYVTYDGLGYDLVRHQPDREPDTLSFEYDAVVPNESAFDAYEATRWEECDQIGDDAFCQRYIPDDLEQKRPLGLPPERPVIGRVLGPSGEDLLVERYDLDPEPFDVRSAMLWDVIRDGEIVGRVRTPRNLRVLWFGAGEIWGAITDELDVSYVVGYRVLPAGD